MSADTDTLLRDLVEIPEAVQKSDFVVSLANGIEHAQRTVDTYVVTEQLADAFDKALSLISSAITDDRSKGAYLHGSFGSGKSHFMAVLHLLLQHHPAARSIRELAPVIARHDAALNDRKVLLVPYHFVGKASMEAGVLGGYVDHIRELHPDAPVPSVFLDEKLFADAIEWRGRLGDERFFAELGGAGDGLEGFGDLVGGWDADSFDRAVAAPPDDEDRRRLAADLVGSFFSSYADLAASSGRGYVPLDEGLAAISRHAQELGYDAVLLFLDELILWLATHMADSDFVARESAKLTLLVEGSARRPIPIVSMVARQRDLKEFIGEGVPGAQRASFSHGLQYQEGRFDTITLADRNLTAIVERRVLVPRSESARAELDAAFEAVAAGAEHAVDTLLSDEADRAAFRRVYPFSPALIEVLVGVSGFLQRERTALRLLLQLLVDRRDDLTVGQLVPLGDLWDVIDAGDAPFDDALRRHYARARQLYTTRLRPMLLETHGVTEEAADSLDRRHAFHTDDRLIKTLLLAALVPGVNAVRGLTVSRLTDLNHGTIRSPIPGQERANVLGKVQRWAAQVGELRVDGDRQDPSVSLQLVGVDTQAIIDQASAQDRVGARIRMVRILLGEALGFDTSEALLPSHRFIWRGRRREVDLAFANVRDEREIPDGEFRSSLDRPKLIIDYPFDPDDDRTWSDDRARAQALRDRLGAQPTVCWLPRSLTVRARRELGRLVVLDFLLTGDRLDQHTQHLPPLQRVEARDVLSGQRDQLRSQLVEVLRQAYGVSAAEPEWVTDDLPLAEQFQTLDATIAIRPPAAASLRDAFDDVLDQLWSSVAPAHPAFHDEVKKAELARTLELVAQAAVREGRRLDVAQPDRRLLTKVVAPLRLGDVGEAHLSLGRHWRDHFHRMHAANPGPMTVARLREWLDEPHRMALDDAVASLVISAYAIDDDRVLTLGGATLPFTVDRLDPRVEVRQQELPDDDTWQAAIARARSVLGLAVSPVKSAANVVALARDARLSAERLRAPVRSLVPVLARIADQFGVPADTPRRRTAAAAQILLDGIATAEDDGDVVRFLARVDVPTTPEALGASIKQAVRVGEAVQQTNVELLDAAFGLDEPWRSDADVFRRRLTSALAADQFTAELSAVLASVSRDVTDLMRRATRSTAVAAESPPASTEFQGTVGPVPAHGDDRPPQAAPAEHRAGGSVAASGHAQNLSGDEARDLLARLLAAGTLRSLEIRWELDT